MMKLIVETWIERNIIQDESKQLFAEAINCFKFNAYKAAFMFIYLGFMNHIKYNVLNSKQPTNVDDIEWDQLINKLKNRDVWEDTLLEMLLNRKNRYFKLSEDLKNQIIYWKNRRNDVAHNKVSEIDHSLMEHYSLFIKNNSHHFYVKHSLEYFQDELKEHYDINLTPHNADLSIIVIKIIESITNDEILSLVDYLFDVIKVYDDNFIIHIIALSNNDSLITKLVEHIFKYYKNFYHHFFRDNVNHVYLLNGKPKLVRSLWKNIPSKGMRYNYFPLIASLLRNNLIPNDQIDEFKNMITSSNIFIAYETQGYDLEVLNNYGIKEYLYKYIVDLLENNVFETIGLSKNLNIIRFYINTYDNSNDIIDVFNNYFFKSNICFALRDYIYRNNSLKEKIVSCLYSVSDDEYPLSDVFRTIKDETPPF